MLHHYSTKMISDIYLLPDGKSIEVQYFNAFWVNTKLTYRPVGTENGEAANTELGLSEPKQALQRGDSDLSAAAVSVYQLQQEHVQAPRV